MLSFTAIFIKYILLNVVKLMLLAAIIFVCFSYELVAGIPTCFMVCLLVNVVVTNDI